MITSKKALVFLSAVVLCLSLATMAVVTETKALPCYELAYSSDCATATFPTWYSTYVVLYSDYSFEASNGGYGDWYAAGSAFYLQYWDGCQELYSGSKKMGFFQCTDGSKPGKDNYPGCWSIRKSKGCIFLDKDANDGQDSKTDESSDLP